VNIQGIFRVDSGHGVRGQLGLIGWGSII
jgi:hypothetical protein